MFSSIVFLVNADLFQTPNQMDVQGKACRADGVDRMS